MSVRVDRAARVPRHISLFSPVLQALLAAGIPVGPNGLITIRGRSSGLQRTAGVAVVEVSGRRWIWAPWGEVNWVLNLRAAGRATLKKRGRTEEVRATELDADERIRFFRDVLAPYARRIPGGITLARIVDEVDLNDPVKAANGTVVFELHPVR
jgi:deazaflavin-dependent oxidoreductase (nitroreductase family)